MTEFQVSVPIGKYGSFRRPSPATFVARPSAALKGLLGFRGRPCALRSATNVVENDSTNSDPYFPTGTRTALRCDSQPKRCDRCGRQIACPPVSWHPSETCASP